MHINENKLGIVSAIIAMMIGMSSCKEVGPLVDLGGGKYNVLLDTTYVESQVQTPEPKNVLIEMLTGVQCINCPNAHIILDNLKAANPRRVIGIAMHSTAEPTAQDEPLPDSRQPLGSDEAQTLVTQFQDPGARPFGAVDRVVHTNVFGQTSIYDDRNNWGGYTATRLATSSPVNMVLTKTYDAATKKITIDVELHYTSAQADSNRLTVFLTEDSIVTSQLQSDNSNDPNYTHNDVLRAAVTSTLGDRINASLVAGTVVRRVLTYTVTSPVWKPEHMHIIALVHRYQNGNSDILQVHDIPVQ